jgi:type IV pilus assembly protein PilN
MIKINLASSTGTSSGISASLGLSGGGDLGGDDARREALKKILIILLPAVGLFAYEQQNIPGKTARLNQMNVALVEAQTFNSKAAASVAEIKKFKEDEAIIESRIAALQKISKDRHREIRVLDLLQSVIPEKAWLTKINILPEKVTIAGMAMSDYEVSSFMESLTKSAFLMDVNLVNSTEVLQDGVTLKKFEITCLLERPQ